MKIVFLDIDGVLNYWGPQEGDDVSRSRFADWVTDPVSGIGEEFVERLNRLTNETGAKICVSSSWRIRDVTNRSDHRYSIDLIDVLRKAGVKAEVVGMTPRLNTGRGFEIQKWMDDHPSVSCYVILDDDAGDIYDEHGDLLIHTDGNKGLQDSDVKVAIETLQFKI